MSIPMQGEVIAAIDGSSLTPAVCQYAAWVSQRLQVPLQLLHHLEPSQTTVQTDLSGSIGLGAQQQLLHDLATLEQQRNALLRTQGKALLDQALTDVVQAGAHAPYSKLRHGALQESLIEAETNTRMLVLGLRGNDHETQQQRIGSQIEGVIRTLHRPILLVNAAFNAPQRFMLAFDGSDAARKALDLVITSPLLQQLACHLVHVGEDDGVIADAEQALLRAGFTPEVAHLMGPADEVLCSYQKAHDIDLMLMGAFGHTRIRGLLLGSFTQRMLQQTRTPLLLLR